MNPAVLNYLQNNPKTQGEGQQEVYNPFDLGIKRAISAARDSLGMTDKQQDKALRRSLLSFGNSIAQEPVQKGFLNNLGAIGRSMNPAIATHDMAEDDYSNQNYQLANQILKYKADEEAAAAKAEERNWRMQHAERALDHNMDESAWRRQHADDQLDEQRRYHDMVMNKPAGGKGKIPVTPQELNNVFNSIDTTIEKIGDKGYRGRARTVLDKFSPGGTRLTPEQTSILAASQILKGKLFNAWGYRAAAEFKELPNISPYNSPEANRAILEQLREITNRQLGAAPSEIQPEALGEYPEEYPAEYPVENTEEVITVVNPETGETKEILIDNLEIALQRGWQRAE